MPSTITSAIQDGDQSLLSDIRGLPSSAPQGHQEFIEGKFAVKMTNRKFTQISPDQAFEHVNRVSKVSGRVIGITR